MLKESGDRRRGPAGRALAWAFALSLVAHLVFTPLAGYLGILAWLFTPMQEEDLSEPERLRSVPFTWLGEEAEPVPEASAQAPALTAPVALTEAPAATPAPPVAPAPPAPARPAEPPPAPGRKPAAGSRDPAHPVALSGVKSELIDSNANVSLLLLSERVREHPLGPRIGKLLVAFPQWNSFFESAQIDPIQDLNRILVVGPEFRRSADLVAIIQHRLGREPVRKAVDRLVRRPPRGRWLNSKLPAARAHADRAERLFVLPSPSLLVVAPLHLEKQLLAMPPAKFPEPEGSQAVVVHVKSPSRALRGAPLALPESIAWLRLDVTPLESGGANVRVTAQDADAQQARANARNLSLAINALTNPDLGALGALLGMRSIAFVDRLDLAANGDRISGEVDVSRAQLERLLGLAEELLEDWNGRDATRRNATSGGPGRPARPATP
jgi:hypothetical protein